MSGHTPGPWRVNYSQFSQVLAENGALIATCAKLGSLTTLHANAQVIALAPDLFRIASRLAALAEGLSNGNSSAEEAACRLAEEARAAIAKAATPTLADEPSLSQSMFATSADYEAAVKATGAQS